MLVLGIDPGYDRCGWAIVDKNQAIRLVACGAILAKSNKTNPISLTARLTILAGQLQEVLKVYRPQHISVEKIFFSKNQKTAIEVAQARGVILSTIGLWDSAISISEPTPNQVKLAVTGNGAADKKQVEKLVRLQVKGVPVEALDDTIDAIAIAMMASSTY